MKTPTRSQQIFLYAAPFVPMTFFQTWASIAGDTGNFLTVACSMLACCLIVLALAWRWDKPSYFDWAVSAYFLTVVTFLFLWPEPAGIVLKRYAVTGVYLCLFAASFLPPVFGFEPFTLHYAKKSTPQSLWENPVFLTINHVMTFTWAGIFGICILLSLYPSVVTTALVPIIIIVGFGVPFNIRFPNYYLKRLGLPPLSAMQAGPEPGRREQPVLNDNHKETAMEQRNPVPRPDSIESFMTIMSMGFNPDRAAQTKAVMQFVFSGEVEGSCHFKIENGQITANEGAADVPDLIIQSPFEVWMDVITGKEDGQMMFMQQKFTASGDFSLLMRMNELFGRD